MTVSKYTLPPPVYLPSSGGYTSSRFVEDPLHQRIFPFRKYSVDEDGRLVCRTRDANRDSRPKPYDRPQRLSGHVASPGEDRPPVPRDLPPTKRVDPSTFARLLQQLLPIAINEPLSFESKALPVCASFDLDPVASEDIISSVKRQFPAIPNIPPASGGSANPEPIVIPATPSAPAPVPPTVPLLPPTTLETPSLVPIKQRRQFSCGSPAYTTWYSTASSQDIASPPPEVVPAVGELYIHHSRLEDAYQIWLYGLDSVWKCVTNAEKVYHPTIADRVLSMRANGTPNWITVASYTTIRGRKGKKAQVE